METLFEDSCNFPFAFGTVLQQIYLPKCWNRASGSKNRKKGKAIQLRNYTSTMKKGDISAKTVYSSKPLLYLSIYLKYSYCSIYSKFNKYSKHHLVVKVYAWGGQYWAHTAREGRKVVAPWWRMYTKMERKHMSAFALYQTLSPDLPPSAKKSSLKVHLLIYE